MHTAPRSLESCELVSMDSCVFHSVQCKMSEANTGCCARGCVARCAVPKCQEGGRPVLCCSRRRSRRTLRPYSLYAKMGRRRPDPNPSVSTLDDYVCVHNTLPPPPASTRLSSDTDRLLCLKARKMQHPWDDQRRCIGAGRLLRLIRCMRRHVNIPQGASSDIPTCW
jgi:hypothetical protein